jgi:hypothetical protein
VKINAKLLLRKGNYLIQKQSGKTVILLSITQSNMLNKPICYRVHMIIFRNLTKKEYFCHKWETTETLTETPKNYWENKETKDRKKETKKMSIRSAQ